MEPNIITPQSWQTVPPYQPATGTTLPPTVSGTGVVSGIGAVSMVWRSFVAASANVSGVVGFGSLGEFASTSSLGFVILTSVAALSQSNTDLYRRAPMLNFPFPFPDS